MLRQATCTILHPGIPQGARRGVAGAANCPRTRRFEAFFSFNTGHFARFKVKVLDLIGSKSLTNLGQSI